MPLDPNIIRKDFPQLDGDTYHYLDAAASSLTPRSVMDAEIEYYTKTRANVHRALFDEAVRATELYEATREKVARFIGGEPGEIIFTSGATESSNMLIRMIDESMKFIEEGKDLVTTVMEHHGALLPLQQFASRRELPLFTIPLRGSALDLDEAKRLIGDQTLLVSAMLASNVTGAINDVAALGALAHEHGALMVVDATAAAGHIAIDVTKMNADALYFSGHKMLAPTGVGVLWVKRSVLETLSPSVFGGHMVARVEGGHADWAEIPSRFEAGTKNISGVIGLGAAIDYLEMLGLDNIKAHNEELAQYAIEQLSTIADLRIIAETDVKKNIGIVSFVCKWAHPHDLAEILARDRVAVRPGHHCAIPLHTALDIDASVRASFHCYNTKADVDALVAGVKKSKEIFS